MSAMSIDPPELPRTAARSPYSILDLKQELGEELVFTDSDSFRLDSLDLDALGCAYESLIQRAEACFLDSRWGPALRLCHPLLDAAWKHLNTGHWKDVPLVWRHAYYLVSYVKAVAEFAIWLEHRMFERRRTISFPAKSLKLECPSLARLNCEMLPDQNSRKGNSKEIDSYCRTFEGEDLRASNSEIVDNSSPSACRTGADGRLCEQYGAAGSTSLMTRDGWRVALTSCDMGLLMGAPLFDGILTRLAARLQRIGNQQDSDSCVAAPPVEQHNDSSILHPNPNPKPVDPLPGQQTCALPIRVDAARAIARCSCPSIETFREAYMRTQTPVVLTDVIDFWPALNERRWTLDYIRHVAGSRLVPVELGSKYTEDSWSQTLITVDDFIRRFIETPLVAADGRAGGADRGGVRYLA